MKRNLILTLFLTITLGIFASTPLLADFIEIGTGTETNNYVPFYGFYDYGWSRVIYLQSEIGQDVEITEISYHVGNTPTNYQMIDQMIYMKHTTDAVYATGDYVDTTDYTLVFDGSLTWDGTGWHTITLDTPFIYNGIDNLEIYYQNHDGAYATGYPSFTYTAQTDRAVYNYADNTFPTDAGNTGSYAVNIRLHYEVAGAPGAPANPMPEDGADQIAVDTGISWTNGELTEDVQVLVDTVNPPVAQVYNGSAVTSLTNIDIGGPLDEWTTYYWQVIASNDDFTTEGPVWQFETVLPPGLVEIGTDTTSNSTTGHPTPYGTYYKNHRVQYLVLASELTDFPGFINNVAFNVEALNNCSPMPNYRIRMKHTDQTELTTTFEVGDYDQVWQDDLFMPEAGWNQHIFTNPFEWDGESNVLIDVVFDLVDDYTQNASVYYTATTGWNTSLYYRSDSQPADQATTGTTSINRANMLLEIQPYVAEYDNDMAATDISGPEVVNMGSPATYTITVRNWGEFMQNDYTVKLMKEGGVELASTQVTVPLEFLETTSVDLEWTPAILEETYVYGQVVLTGDENPANDETTPLDVIVVGDALSGTYTINWDGTGDYDELSSAVDDLILVGIDGSVIFEIAPGTYIEQLYIPEINGASEFNTITFTGMGLTPDAVELSYEPTESADRHVVRLEGAKHIRFDNMSITAGDNSDYGWPVHIMSNSQDIEITDCEIITVDTSTSSNYLGIVVSGSNTSYTSGASNVSDILIENCTVVGGYYNVTFRGSGSDDAVTGIQALNNELLNAYYGGYYVYHTSNPIIKYNLMDLRLEGSSSSRGAYIYYVHDGMEFAYNTIINAAQYGIYGLYWNGTETTPNWVYNNQFGGGFSNTGSLVRGIYLGSSTSYVNLYYNSFYVDSGTGAAFYATTGLSELRSVNNSFVYDGPGDGHALYLSSTDSVLEQDHNNYYAGGSANFVYYGTDVADLAALQAVNIPVGNDQNSLQGDPMYTGTTNLLPFGPQLNAAGTPIVGIDDDIVGTLRDDLEPCIGAYEFEVSDEPQFSITPDQHDFGIVLVGTTTPQEFTIMNTGGGVLSLSPADIWIGDDVNFNLTNITEAVNLASGESTTIEVSFSPSDELIYTTTLFIDDGLTDTRVVNEIPLSGEGFDATVTEFPWDEGFEDDFPPIGWTVVNGIDGSYWEQSSVSSNTGSYAARSYNGSGSSYLADEWMISPPIVMDDGVELSFYGYSSQAPNGDKEKMRIMILDQPYFNTTDLHANATLLTEEYFTQTWSEYTVSLGAHTGTKHIAFNYYITENVGFNWIYVDDVNVDLLPTDAILGVTPEEANFTATLGGTSLPVTFTLSNVGTGTLSITDGDIIITGDDAAEFSMEDVVYPIELAAGESSDIEIVFEPLTEGEKTANIQITHTGINSPTDIPLSGFAYPESTVIFGVGEEVNGTTTAAPINIFYRSLRGQMVYHASELLAAGIEAGDALTHFGFYVVEPPLHDLPDFRIRMIHTTADDSSEHIEVTAANNVYFNTAYMPVEGDWDLLELDEPFVWNGVDNILVDTAFAQVPSYNSSGQQRIYDVPNGFRFVRSDGSDQSENTTTTTSSNKPQAIMVFGEVIPPEFPPPTNLVAIPGDGVVNLEWDEPVFPDSRATRRVETRAEESRDREFQGYNVYRDDVMINTALVTLTEYEDTDVVNGVTYEYYVTAVYDTGESDPSNWVLATPLTTISEFPYFQDFEDGPQSWTTGAVSGNDQWELGTPAQTNINSAYSGVNAYMTGLTENYENSSNCWLMAPAFDFSELDSPMFSVWLNLWTENNFDGMILEYSIDGGNTWVHFIGDDGFYNNDSTYGPIPPPKWSGQVGEWVLHSTSLTGLENQSSVMLRFRFGSDGSVQYEGIAVDDVTIWDAGAVVLNPPQNLTAEAGDGVVNLEWDAPATRTLETDTRRVTTRFESTRRLRQELLGYNVYRDDVLVNAALVTETEYEDTNVVNGVTYTYYVTAVYDLGESEPSNEVEATPEGVIELNPPENLAYEIVDNVNVLLTWEAPAGQTLHEFRYDDGIQDGQLGFQGGTNNGVMGSVHSNDAEIHEVHWFTTDEGGPHAAVNLFIFGLNAQGLPNGSDILFQQMSIPNVDMQWNEFVLPDPVSAPNGFMLAMSYTGFLGLGTDDGIGAPWEFQPNTHYFSADYTGNQWSTVESAGFEANFMLRAYGHDNGELRFSRDQLAGNTVQEGMMLTNSAGRSYSSTPISAVTDETNTIRTNTRELLGYNVYRDGVMINTDLVEELEYLDEDLEDGTYTYHVTAVYDEGESEASNSVEVVIEDIDLDPPVNLTAEVVADVNVDLDWDAPGTATGEIEELIYDNDGNYTGAYSYTGYTMATQMSPAEPCQILTLRFFTSDSGDFNAEVYNWAGTQPGDDLLFTQSTAAIDEQWVDVDVSGEDLWIDGDFMVGFGSLAQTPYVGYDGNLDNGRSWDRDNTSGAWAPWNEAYLIRAVVLYPDGRIAELSPTVVQTIPNPITPGERTNLSISGKAESTPVRGNRDLLGYKVYRDGVEIAETGATVTTYYDQNLDSGEYTYWVTALYTEGESEPSNEVVVEIESSTDDTTTAPMVTRLNSNYPNPFNPETTISFSLQQAGPVTIEIFNIRGQKVTTLVDAHLDAGEHRIVWDSRSDRNRESGSGIYFYRMQSGEYTATKKMILMK